MWDKEQMSSRFTAEQIGNLLKKFPAVEVLKNANGQPTGAYRLFGRFSFPAVFEPDQMEGSPGGPKYSVTMILPPDYNTQPLRTAIAAKIAENPKWKGVKPSALKNPLRDQGEKTLKGYGDEGEFIRLSANPDRKPRVVDAKGNPITDETLIYPGAWGCAIGNLYTFDNNGNRGIGMNFQTLIKLLDDEPLGGSSVSLTDALGGLPDQADLETEYGDLM